MTTGGTESPVWPGGVVTEVVIELDSFWDGGFRKDSIEDRISPGVCRVSTFELLSSEVEDSGVGDAGTVALVTICRFIF